MLLHRDGVPHCSDHSDEINCSRTSLILVTTVLTMVGLSCQNVIMNCGVMVRVLQTCDGRLFNRRDETECGQLIYLIVKYHNYM